MQHDSSLAALAVLQHGAFTRSQASDAGFTDHQIRARVRSGAWIEVDIATYRYASTPVTPLLLTRATCLASGGVASHRTASSLLELWASDELDVTVPSNRRYRNGRAAAHRSLDLVPELDVTVVDGIPCTNVVRTLLDVGAVLPFSEVERIFDRALNRELVQVEAVTRRFLQVARRGRRGVGAARRVLEARDPSMAPLESELEIRVLRILLANGLPTPVAQHEVRIGGRTFRIDLAYPDLKIAIELDGRVHNEGSQFDRDRARQNLLALDGWLVLRFTWPMMRQHPADIADRVREAIRLRRDLAA